MRALLVADLVRALSQLPQDLIVEVWQDFGHNDHGFGPASMRDITIPTSGGRLSLLLRKSVAGTPCPEPHTHGIAGCSLCGGTRVLSERYYE